MQEGKEVTMTRRTNRTAAAVAVCLLALTGGVAHAAMTTTATATPTVTAATWGITPTGSSGTGSPALSWDSIGSLVGAYRYFRLVNTGTVTLRGATYSV